MNELKWIARTLALVGVAMVLLLARPASASYKFCTKIHYNYSDDGLGEDYLLPGGTVPAYSHYMVLYKDGSIMWQGYAGSTDGCAAQLASSAGRYVLHTYPIISIGSTYIETHLDTLDSYTYAYTDFGALPANTAATTVKTSHVGYGYAGEGIFNVSAIMTRLTRPELGFDFGIRPGSYRILAQKACPGAISCFSPADDALYLGYDADLYGWDNNSKSVVGHEMGHYIQHRLFGSPAGQASYCHSVPTDANNLCRCDHVPSPNTSYCSGTVLVNRLHCLQSRENLTAALGEGWGHFFATTLFNNPAETNATFAYYKPFKRADLQVVYPPVSHNPLAYFRWMESRCSSQMAGLGTELDWMNFLYSLRSTTTNSYSFSNFEAIFESSNVCNGACTSSDTVTWSKLSNAATALYPGAKASRFTSLGDSHGVNH